MMSASMQQALHLLQIPLLELQAFIEQQTVLNPLLELQEETNEEKISQEEEEAEKKNQDEEEQELVIDEKDLTILTRLDEEWSTHFSQNEPFLKENSQEDKLRNYTEQSIQQKESLYDHLIQEAHDSFNTAEDFAVAEILIGYIESSGFLTTPLLEICTFHQLDKEKVQQILAEIQTFEPYGIGAATLQECFLIQLRCLGKKETLAYQIVDEHYENLIYNHIPLIQKSIKCSYEEIQQAIEQEIAKLDLHPGIHLSSTFSQILIPEGVIREEEGKLVVEVDREYLSSLRVNSFYLNMLNDETVSLETKNFIKHHFFSARWLMRNLHQRFSTLQRIVQSLAQRQQDFFLKPEGKLIPLTMLTLAEELKVHESTVARLVSNKYIQTPKGILALKTFFTHKYLSEKGESLSSSTVKQTIFNLIKQENKQSPLSDEKISLLLKEKGISCARRTVAKYRSLLKIGTVQQRKKFS